MLIVAQMAYARRLSLLDPSDPFMTFSIPEQCEYRRDIRHP
jgi:hypothetical protein